eukprot:4216008-Pleurochrysis_carterae.AAC.1
MERERAKEREEVRETAPRTRSHLYLASGVRLVRERCDGGSSVPSRCALALRPARKHEGAAERLCARASCALHTLG